VALFISEVMLINGKWDYDVPDPRLISGAKYKFIPGNFGNPNTKQATCAFEYPDDLGDNMPRRESVGTTIYNNFASVNVTPTSATITADGIDGTEITAEFSEQGGYAFFSVNFPDGTQTQTQIPIDQNGEAKLPADKTSTTTPGTILVVIKSSVWHNVAGFDDVEITAT